MTMPLSETACVKRAMDQVTCINPVKNYLPVKPLDLSNQSLAAMMASRRSSLQNIQRKFAFEMQQRRVSFGEVAPSLKLSMASVLPTATPEGGEEPPMKRRRFERRNSKTAAMLISSMSSIITKDFCEEDGDKPADRTSTAPSSSLADGNSWDGGLEIAEELVRHLKLRRRNNPGA
jgi:hypothetical protein